MRYAGNRRSEHNPLRSVPVLQAGACPDTPLLILCSELRTLQGEWQRLWEATPEDGEPGPADAVCRDYSETVWPGVFRREADRGRDPVRDLIALKATTLEGMRAKAAAIKALDDAAGYLESIRDDSNELMMSLLQDVAGAAAMPMGEDAEMEVAHASAG